MKLFNKILLVFIAISMITLYGGWRFIHSEKFSNEISRKVSNVLTKKFGAQLRFTGVEFQLFPLATTLKNVKVLKKDPSLFDLELEAEKLTAVFSYSSFMSSDLQIEEVYLNKGILNLDINKKSDEDIIIERLNINKIFSHYQEVLSQIPVRLNLISLKDVQVRLDGSAFFVKGLSLSPHRRQLRLKTSIESISIETKMASTPEINVDSLDALLFFNKEEWRIDGLTLKKKTNEVSLQGTFLNKHDFLHLTTKGSLKGNAEDFIAEIPGVPKSLLPIVGKADANFVTSGRVDDPDAAINFVGRNVHTQWINLNKVHGTVKKVKKLIILEKLHAENGKEKYSLRQRQAFFDLKNAKFTNFHFKLRLQDAFSNTFLYYLRNTLEILKVHLTGDVDVMLDEEKAVFLVNDKLTTRNLRLTNKNGKTDILKNKGFELRNSSVTVHSDYSVSLNTNLNMPQTSIKAAGKIDSERIDILVSDSRVDLKSIGPIAGVSIGGNGSTYMQVTGPLDDVRFNFVVDWNNFNLLDLHLGRAVSKFSFSLKNLEIFIEELKGKYNNSEYSAKGTLGFDNGQGMDLKIDVSKGQFSDLRQMLALVFKNIKIPLYPDFSFSSSLSLKGGYEVENLRIEGNIKGTEIIFGNEEADRLSSKFTLINNQLSFKQLKIMKARGQLMANVGISLSNKYIELNGAAQGLRLNDFNTYKRLNLEYDGDLFLDFDGNGTPDDFNSRFKMRVANAFIGNIPASTSNALFYVNSEDIVTNASLLGGKIKLDSSLKIKTGMTTTKGSIETDDIRELLGILSGHNISEKGITGKIKADLNTQIGINGEGVRRFYLNISQLNLKKGSVDMKVDSRFNKIEVEDGNVKTWDLRFTDGEEFFTSKGRNISNGAIALDQKFAIKANLLEILSEYIDRAVGVIKGSNQLVLENSFSIKDFTLGAENLSLKIRSLPGYFNNLNFNVVKKGEVFELSKLTGKYGEGDIRVTGRVVFDDLYPQVNLDYRIDRATVPLFKKSNILVNSTGTLTGTELPYRLIGKLFLLHGEFLDDPADFTKEGKVNVDEYKKYLPQKDLGKKAILDINVSFDIINPLVLKNNMAEVYFKGNGQATGDVMSPELNTRLEIVPTLSKFKFKGHDFELNQGYVEIRDRGKNRLSDLKFTGVSKISDYDMKLDISGNISKVNVDLSSEPALSKEDLLSLITFGVTSDMSRNLEAGERKFVTTVGIGTLLVDQLKINEDLNSSLGLKLSVQPEFKENESTLIQGKAAVSDSSTSRLKSATKIKINKQVTNKVDVSLSSTVGGSLEQKQEMNVNFNINKHLSVEGVYEMKPTESENTNTPSSLGADLKYRWSF